MRSGRVGSGDTPWVRFRGVLHRYRTELLIALLVVVAVGPIMHDYRAQQASRYALTAAIVEHGTVRLDDYVDVLGIDKAVYGGRVYSDKAPGQPVLAVPFFALFRVMGGIPATTLQVKGNVGLWWLTLWFATIPGAILAVLMYRRAKRFSPETALLAAVAMTYGTLLLPFSALLFGHVLAGLLGYSAWLLLATDEHTRGRFVSAGVLTGAAVLVEYTAVIFAVVFAIFVLARMPKMSAWYVAGGAPFAMALAAYNWLVFGNPLTLSYQFSAFNGVTESARPVTDIFATLGLDRLAEVFLAPRGFLIATPIVVLGVVGLVLMARNRSLRPEALVAGAVFFGFLLIPVMWGNPWGGDSPGARYVVPALPFLTVPVALVWRRLPVLSVASAALGTLTMGLATLTDPLLPRDIGFGLGTWVSRALSGAWVPTVFTQIMGGAGWFVHAALLILCGFLLRAAWRCQDWKGKGEAPLAPCR